jgi:hypothetical protein
MKACELDGDFDNQSPGFGRAAVMRRKIKNVTAAAENANIMSILFYGAPFAAQ